MNNLTQNSQLFVKSKPRRTESFLDARPRVSQGSTRAVRVFTFHNSKRIQSNHTKTIDLNSTALHITKQLLNIPQTCRSSRPNTAANKNSNKTRLASAKSIERYKHTLIEEQKQHFFGPMVKKLYTPLNYKGTTATSRYVPEATTENASIINYLIGKDLGKGAYAVVKYGIHKPTNRKVAIKIYDKSKFLEPNRFKNAQREIQILQKLSHPHIMKLYESIETDEFLYLILELITGCSLHEYLKRRPDRRLEEADACRIFRQLTEALEYCHANDITHRDVKLENILLDQRNNVKLIDFGFSTSFPVGQKVKIFCGTPSYMAPEIVSRIEYVGPPVDIWASGVVLFGMLCGYFPFKSQTDKECYKKILTGAVHVPGFVAQGPKEVLDKIFVIDPVGRITATALLNEEWTKKKENSKGDEGEDSIYLQLVIVI